MPLLGMLLVQVFSFRVIITPSSVFFIVLHIAITTYFLHSQLPCHYYQNGRLRAIIITTPLATPLKTGLVKRPENMVGRVISRVIRTAMKLFYYASDSVERDETARRSASGWIVTDG